MSKMKPEQAWIQIWQYQTFLIKSGLSEKHTKFVKIFLMVLTNQLIYLVNVWTMTKIFSNYVCFSKSLNFNWLKKPFYLLLIFISTKLCINGVKSFLFLNLFLKVALSMKLVFVKVLLIQILNIPSVLIHKKNLGR